MSLVVIKDNHIKFMGTNYFVANAQKVTIGAYGEKATPIFGQNKLEVAAHVPAPKLDGKVKIAGPFDIDVTRSSKSDFTTAVGASIKVVGFNGSQNEVYEELTRKRLKLVQLFVDEIPMMNAVNASPKVLANLDRFGKDARVAHELFVVMEASFATSFTSGTKSEITADAAGIVTVAVSGGKTVKGKDRLTLYPGMGLAYLLLKLDWKQGKIKDVDVDEWSLN